MWRQECVCLCYNHVSQSTQAQARLGSHGSAAPAVLSRLCPLGDISCSAACWIFTLALWQCHSTELFFLFFHSFFTKSLSWWDFDGEMWLHLSHIWRALAGESSGSRCQSWMDAVYMMWFWVFFSIVDVLHHRKSQETPSECWLITFLARQQLETFPLSDSK